MALKSLTRPANSPVAISVKARHDCLVEVRCQVHYYLFGGIMLSRDNIPLVHRWTVYPIVAVRRDDSKSPDGEVFGWNKTQQGFSDVSATPATMTTFEPPTPLEAPLDDAHQKPRAGKQVIKHCPHGRQKAFCIPCGGSQICQHQKQRHQCKKCNGSQVCCHQRYRYQCIDCGGSQVCQHQRRRASCKECRPATQNQPPTKRRRIA
jgi:hypothetical protein